MVVVDPECAVTRLVRLPAMSVRLTLEEKPRPVAVTVVAPAPAGRELGEMEVRTGLTITGRLLETALFWVLVTVREYLPQMAISPAGTVADRVVSFTLVVIRGVPDQLATGRGPKAVTPIVRVKVGP